MSQQPQLDRFSLGSLIPGFDPKTCPIETLQSIAITMGTERTYILQVLKERLKNQYHAPGRSFRLKQITGQEGVIKARITRAAYNPKIAKKMREIFDRMLIEWVDMDLPEAIIGIRQNTCNTYIAEGLSYLINEGQDCGDIHAEKFPSFNPLGVEGYFNAYFYLKAVSSARKTPEGMSMNFDGAVRYILEDQLRYQLGGRDKLLRDLADPLTAKERSRQQIEKFVSLVQEFKGSAIYRATKRTGLSIAEAVSRCLLPELEGLRIIEVNKQFLEERDFKTVFKPNVAISTRRIEEYFSRYQDFICDPDSKSMSIDITRYNADDIKFIEQSLNELTAAGMITWTWIQGEKITIQKV